jgi:hypothetical protein
MSSLLQAALYSGCLTYALMYVLYVLYGSQGSRKVVASHLKGLLRQTKVRTLRDNIRAFIEVCVASISTYSSA